MSGPSSIPPPEMDASFSFSVVSPCPSFRIDLLLMPEHHRGRLTKGSRWLQLLDRLLRLRKFGLHQPWGGNCHQETSGLMGWIYAPLSSFSVWSKLEEAEVTDLKSV